MAFLSGLRLPIDVERGAIGGPRYNTTVLPLESGFERRNINWLDSVGAWDVGYGLMKKFEADPDSVELDVDYLISMFRTVRGKGHSFRFRDWSDYEVGLRHSNADIPAQFLGNAGATVYQAFKRYQIGALDPEDRPLTKLVEDTVTLYVGGVELDEADYSVNYDTGLITLDSAAGGTVTGRFEFDCHVRFDTDDLRISMQLFNAGEWRDVPIMELLGTGL